MSGAAPIASAMAAVPMLQPGDVDSDQPTLMWTHVILVIVLLAIAVLLVSAAVHMLGARPWSRRHEALRNMQRSSECLDDFEESGPDSDYDDMNEYSHKADEWGDETPPRSVTSVRSLTRREHDSLMHYKSERSDSARHASLAMHAGMDD